MSLPPAKGQRDIRRPTKHRLLAAGLWLCGGALLMGGLVYAIGWAAGELQLGEAEAAAVQPVATHTAQVTVAESQTGASHAEALDAALELARLNLATFRRDVDDYTATLVKRERVDGVLGKQTMFCKIRNRKLKDGRVVVPLSIYLRYIEPAQGREVIWVEGRNSDNLVAHDTGLSGLVRVNLATNNTLAMRNNRYPIEHLGIEHLLERAVERGEREQDLPGRELSVHLFAELAGRPCIAFQVKQVQPAPGQEISRARFYFDNELRLPVRYVAYGPSPKSGRETVVEDYHYRNLRLNVGLTDADFDPDNGEYAYP